MPRFKVLAGLHVSGTSSEDTRKVYKRGDVFDTTTDKQTALCDRDKQKYERVSDPVTFRRNVPSKSTKPGAPVESTGVEEVEVDLAKLDHMTDKELKQFADEYGINTRGATDRATLLKNIKEELNKL
jgi:hypothetical protein